MKQKIVKLVPDEIFLRFKYFFVFKRWPNYRYPKMFSEKLQWLKLNYRDPSHVKLVDKIKVKEYVKNCIGEEYIIRTLGVWDSFDEIDFDTLPNQFVLKCTHDSGSIIVCKDKASFDFKKAKEKIGYFLKRNYYWEAREWPYKKVKPMVMAEEFLFEKEGEAISDHKFYCFHGKPELYMIKTNVDTEFSETYYDFFDMDGNFLKTDELEEGNDILPKISSNFGQMKELAEILAHDFPHIRVDFYDVNEKIYFGELTFFPDAGFDNEFTKDWDLKLGELIKLEEVKIIR